MKSSPRLTESLVLATLFLLFGGPPLAEGQALNLAVAENSPLNAERVLLEQPAHLSITDANLATALSLLHMSAGVPIVFSETFIPERARVSCECESMTVGEALDRLLAETNLQYAELRSQVLIEPRETLESLEPAARLVHLAAAPLQNANLRTISSLRNGATVKQQGTVTGRVTAARTGRPLSGVQVFVDGTTIGSLTDGGGEYRLTNVPAGDVVIRAQMIGYSTGEQNVSVSAGETVTANLELREEAVGLDAIVVTGAGREARVREMGTSVGRIGAAEFENAPVRNPEDILMGREPGVTVQLRSGQPGSMGHITLRGATSVSGTRNQPLIYVDGIRLYSHGLRGAQNARQGVHPLQSIAAQDIDRIEIVRGAAAATLYGSEAAAGVIQVFTKQGASGAPRWDVEIGTGVNNIGHVGPASDPTALYTRCSGEMTALSRATWEPVTMFDPTCPAGGSWLESGALWDVNASVQGGVDDFRYFVSGRHGHEEGIVGDGYADNSNFRGNFSFGVTDNLNLSFQSAYSTGTVRWIPDGDRGSGFFNNVMGGPTTHFQDSAECSALGIEVDHCLVNNRILSHQTSHQWTDHFTLGGTVRWDPSRAFDHRFTVGYDFLESLGQEIIEFGFHRPARRLGRLINYDQNRATLSADYVGSWTHDNVFGRDIGSAFSWGFQVVETQSHDYRSQADDFAGPGLATMADAASTVVTVDDQIRVVNPGIFLQEMLSFNDRLFITLGARIDGHSAFGRDFGFQTYPKVGVSYVVSDHDFWPSHMVESFRLRGALGDAGQAPGAFDATRMWSTLPGPGGQAGFTPDVLGNPDLGPERTREMEGGFEAAALDGRISLGLNVYQQDTHDALVGVQPIPSQGFLSRQLENLGHIRNRGFEVQLDGELLRLPQANWSARAHYSQNRSEAIDLGGEVAMSSQLQQIREGHPVPSFFGPRLLNPGELADPIYSDEDEYLGTPWPVHNVGIGTTLMLGQRVTFDAQGEFQGGHHVYNSTGYNMAWDGTWQPCFDTQMALAAGDQNALGNVTARDRVRCAISGAVRDPRQWLEPADFFKLRVASISYRVPERWLRGVQGATVTLSGRNFLTITDYTGLAVEANQGAGPNVMTRRDHMQIPPYRTFRLSVRTTF